MSELLRRAALSHQICIDVTGADAAGFLHGQLTNELPAGTDRFALAAWNDARGRVRALFRVLRAADGCRLLAERETADAVVTKLGMYVLRAQVELRIDESRRVCAVLGNAAEWLAAHGVDLPDVPGAAAATGALRWLRIGPQAVHVVGPETELDAACSDLDETPANDAELAEIELGLARIRPATELKFVPQMLNLDRVGAISFTKGCYPGQEVVARLHHLGAVKRRMQRFGFAARGPLPQPGDEVLAGGQGVGEVIRAATRGSRGALLAVVQLDALDAPLSLAGEPGTDLEWEPLPYETRS